MCMAYHRISIGAEIRLWGESSHKINSLPLGSPFPSHVSLQKYRHYMEKLFTLHGKKEIPSKSVFKTFIFMVKRKLRAHLLLYTLFHFQLLGVFPPPRSSPSQSCAGSGIFEDWPVVSTRNISYFISNPVAESRNILSFERMRNLCISQTCSSWFQRVALLFATLLQCSV